MADTYQLSKKKLLNDERYVHFLHKRGIQQALYYTKPELRYPTDDEIISLNLIGISWKPGDSLAKYAFQYYNSYSDWWIIAYFNKISSEFELREGDSIFIPMPRDEIFKMINGKF